MRKTVTVDMDIPAILGGPFKKGDTVVVVKTFWYNGEGWAKLADGRRVPDVFLGDELYN